MYTAVFCNIITAQHRAGLALSYYLYCCTHVVTLFEWLKCDGANRVAKAVRSNFRICNLHNKLHEFHSGEYGGAIMDQSQELLLKIMLSRVDLQQYRRN